MSSSSSSAQSAFAVMMKRVREGQEPLEGSKRARPAGNPSGEVPADIAESKSGEPLQPKAGFLPNAQGRPFQADWYVGNPWLEWSRSTDKAYCFACRFFYPPAAAGFGPPNGSFVSSGFSNFKKGVEKLNAHKASAGHKEAMVRWATWKAAAEKEQSVSALLAKHDESTLLENLRGYHMDINGRARKDRQEFEVRKELSKLCEEAQVLEKLQSEVREKHLECRTLDACEGASNIKEFAEKCGIELATEESVDIDAVVGGIVEEPTGDASNIKFVHQEYAYILRHQ
ncbi:hypothetical protein Pmar_PMAR026381 [Perkinsus marinus ATCC 50983]|uniref:TTF-type domain-containing protein n=1 Tax=Perkinsus marinus (strain ATCC 50983 / TXsc) TaxID=423536 RepID=C5LEL1_PERM5|nr:hypothetical protein Pmar_PMAR026381 [Perkinsus marinus ATCC 50983]EER04829.1 hypothetical protein Pmar_PMAR026381 [Perkinsus marinus ATCC 50983]|eukprot:XP_002773013.1 hypothetical protein Pmar_PMAR026381 [Perkinsus marinus ATCC 50983]